MSDSLNAEIRRRAGFSPAEPDVLPEPDAILEPSPPPPDSGLGPRGTPMPLSHDLNDWIRAKVRGRETSR